MSRIERSNADARAPPTQKDEGIRANRLRYSKRESGRAARGLGGTGGRVVRYVLGERAATAFASVCLWVSRHLRRHPLSVETLCLTNANKRYRKVVHGER